MKTISLTDGVVLPEMFEGLPRIATAVVDTDVLAALYSDASPQWTWVEGEAELVADPSGDALIVLVNRNGRTTPLPRFCIQSRWVVFAMMPEGGWVVGRTARNIATHAPHDTVLHDSTGKPIRSIDAGSGVALLQTSADGSFWIGHDDEEPPDAKFGGVSHFLANGDEAFYRDCKPGPVKPDEIDTPIPFACCYALNVVERSAWTQHYDSMLISRFEPDGRAQHWMTEFNGAAALAVGGPIIARMGRYDDRQHEVSVFSLGEQPRSEFLGRISFDVDGWQPKYPDWIDGKGDTFHIVHDSKWYRITLDDILSHIGARIG